MRVFLCFLSSIAIGCSSAAKFDRDIERGDCEAAADSIPEQKDLTNKMARSSKQLGGKLISYSVTGAAYTVEVLWDTLGDTIMFVGLCGPTLAVLSAASPNASNLNGATDLPCLPGKLDALGAPALGRKTFNATRPLRCPDLKPLTKSLMRVVQCYKNEGTQAGLSKAKKSLEALRASGDFYNCLPDADQDRIEYLLRAK